MLSFPSIPSNIHTCEKGSSGAGTCLCLCLESLSFPGLWKIYIIGLMFLGLHFEIISFSLSLFLLHLKFDALQFYVTYSNMDKNFIVDILRKLSLI